MDDRNIAAEGESGSRCAGGGEQDKEKSVFAVLHDCPIQEVQMRTPSQSADQGG